MTCRTYVPRIGGVSVGYRNAEAVFARYPNLPHRAFRLLVYMALMTLDEETKEMEPRLYFRGREDQARGLGIDIPLEPFEGDSSPEAEEARKARKSAFEVVRRSVQALVEAGAVTRVEGGRGGVQAVYRVELDDLPTESQTQRNVGPQTQRNVAPDPTKRCSRPNETLAPKEKNIRKRKERASKTPGTTSPAPVDEPVDNDDSSTRYDEARDRLTAAGAAGHAAMSLATEEGITDIRAQVIRAAQILEETK